MRVAASLKNRIVSANVIARRLASSASSNRLAKALLQLGQLVRTIYLLRYFNDPALRQQVRTQLNRGEARQDLAQRLFFADQGMFRSGDYYQMMDRASRLSLLSNAVLVYNALRIGQVLERAKAQGQAFTPEAIAHVSPLARRHVISTARTTSRLLKTVMPRRNYACNTLAFKSARILCEGLVGTAWMAAYSRGSYFCEIGGEIGLGRSVRVCRTGGRASPEAKQWYVRAVPEARCLRGWIRPAHGAAGPLMVLATPAIPAWLR